MRMLSRNKTGFTLVEVMVAIVIMLVGLLGLLAAVNVATEQNLRNATRNEAMLIAEDYMNRLRVEPFANISSPATLGTTYSYGPKLAQSRLRGVSTNYTVLRTAMGLTGTSALLTVNVLWTFKNTQVSQGLQTVRSSQ
jgi:type IV pilus assembly protein PilV